MVISMKSIEETFRKALIIMEAAVEICIEPNKDYSFTCPVCGGTAHAYMVKSNGHHHGYCNGCRVSFAE